MYTTPENHSLAQICSIGNEPRSSQQGFRNALFFSKMNSLRNPDAEGSCTIMLLMLIFKACRLNIDMPTHCSNLQGGIITG